MVELWSRGHGTDGGAVTRQLRGLEKKDLSLTNITGLHGVSPLTGHRQSLHPCLLEEEQKAQKYTPA